MADADLSARQQAEGHKTLLLLETEFNAKPRTTVLSIQGTQIRALAQFPSLFQTYPYPMILNAAILKLADWFHHGNNVVRMHIYKVLEGVSKDHFTKIINVDETMRRIIPVLGSNDPTARALTLRVLGCMAIIFKDSLDVQHGLLQGIQKSTDRFETEAAVWACDQFCARSTTFLSVMFIRIQSKLADPTTSFDIQLKLIKILRHMHSDIVMSRQAKQLCLKLLEQQNSNERLVIVVLRTLTKLLSVALIDQQEQIDRLLIYLLEDNRIAIQQSVLQDLEYLSRNDIMFDASHVTALLRGIAASPASSPRVQQNACKCAETIVRTHRTLIDQVLRQPSSSTERQTLLEILDSWRTKLDTSIQQQQYNIAIGYAQLLVVIIEISAKSTTTEELNDAMYDASYNGESLFYDYKILLKHVASQIFEIPMDSLYNNDGDRCKHGRYSYRRIKKWMDIRSRLLLLLNNGDGKDAFIEGFNVMLHHTEKQVGSIILSYCTSIVETCVDLSTWFPSLAFESLENKIDSPAVFMNILRLLFRTVPANKTIMESTLLFLRRFGKWDEKTSKYNTNGWNLYLMGIEAGICGWYSVMHTVMNDLQSLVESDGCLYWLSSLSLLGSAEWLPAQDNDDDIPLMMNRTVDLHVAALTKLKAFNAITGRARIQTWFLRLRMEMVHAIEHLLKVLMETRHGNIDEYRRYKMMNNCANHFRQLASRYDSASQYMTDDSMLTLMEDYKISALVLEHASRACINFSNDSFFYTDPTLLSLLFNSDNITMPSISISSRLRRFRKIYMDVLQEVVQWEEQKEDENEKHYLDVIETFCQTLLATPIILPPSFFQP